MNREWRFYEQKCASKYWSTCSVILYCHAINIRAIWLSKRTSVALINFIACWNTFNRFVFNRFSYTKVICASDSETFRCPSLLANSNNIVITKMKMSLRPNDDWKQSFGIWVLLFSTNYNPRINVQAPIGFMQKAFRIVPIFIVCISFTIFIYPTFVLFLSSF